MPVFRNDLETRTWGNGPQRTSYKIIDSHGNVVEFQDLFEHLEKLLHDGQEQIYKELKTLRMMIAEDTGQKPEEEDINEIEFEKNLDNDIDD